MEERVESTAMLTLDKKEIQDKALDSISKQRQMRQDRMTHFLIVYRYPSYKNSKQMPEFQLLVYT